MLHAAPYFRALPAAELPQLHDSCLLHRLEAGEIVLLKGALSPSLYVVRSGSVALYETSVEGKEQVLRTARPGETFNDVAAFDGGPSGGIAGV